MVRKAILLVLLFGSFNSAYADDQNYRAAYDALRAGRFSEAEDLFRKEGTPEAKLGLGVALYRQGKWEDALKIFESGDGAEFAYNAGNTLTQLKRYPEAVSQFEKALKRNPRHHDAQENREYVKKLIPPPPPDQQRTSSQQQSAADSQENADKSARPDQSAEDSSEDSSGQPDHSGAGSEDENKPGESEKSKDSQPTEEKPGSDPGAEADLEEGSAKEVGSALLDSVQESHNGLVRYRKQQALREQQRTQRHLSPYDW